MPDEKTNKIWTVSELNSIVKGSLEGTFAYPFWIEGEISGINSHRSGHLYMTLKDENSQIKVTFFNGAMQAKKLGLEQGAKIEVYGKISVYHPRGEYQFNISQIRPKGIGDLHGKFEEMKKKLHKEGLFDASRKKKIPLLPLHIGVVTSPDGAAIKDFLTTITNRFPNLHIRIYPAAVQGKGAEIQIADGIKFFNKIKFPDVIVITRGGGSIEDLWAFNEESLARTIANSDIPIISAVGHEVDYTIADFVADLRAPTPTAAAEIVIEKKEYFLDNICEFKRRFEMSLRLALEKSRTSLVRLESNRIFTDPLSIIRDREQMLDEVVGRFFDEISDLTRRKKAIFDILNAKIAMLSPYKVLDRGYSILQRKSDGSLLRNSEVEIGEELTAILSTGELDLRVEGKK
jgi:exodeoxyribonuclease VII large subunit